MCRLLNHLRNKVLCISSQEIDVINSIYIGIFLCASKWNFKIGLIKDKLLPINTFLQDSNLLLPFHNKYRVKSYSCARLQDQQWCLLTVNPTVNRLASGFAQIANSHLFLYPSNTGDSFKPCTLAIKTYFWIWNSTQFLVAGLAVVISLASCWATHLASLLFFVRNLLLVRKSRKWCSCFCHLIHYNFHTRSNIL